MRLATLLCVTSVLGGCTILTDLDDYRVGDGDASADATPEGAVEDGGADADMVPECDGAARFTERTDWLINLPVREIVRNNLPDRPMILLLAGIADEIQTFTTFATATFHGARGSEQLIRLNEAIPAGEFSVFAIVDVDNVPGYQPDGLDVAFEVGLCADGTSYLRPTTDFIDDLPTRYTEDNPNVVQESLNFYRVDVGSIHATQRFETGIVHMIGAVKAYVFASALPQPGTSIYIPFPRNIPGRFDAFMYADHSDPKGFNASDHHWIAKFTNEAGETTFDPHIGFADPEMQHPIFAHNAGINTREIPSGGWPITYE